MLYGNAKTSEIKPFDFHSDIEVNLHGTDEKELYDTIAERILEKIATFLATESESRFHSVIKLKLRTVSYKPLREETYVPLPKALADKKVITSINMKNSDNKCFLWCVLRALNPSKNNPQRLDEELMGKENTLNMEGIDYPVSLKDLNKFEKQTQPCPSRYSGTKEKAFILLETAIVRIGMTYQVGQEVKVKGQPSHPAKVNHLIRSKVNISSGQRSTMCQNAEILTTYIKVK